MSTTAPIKDKKISTNYTNILAGKGEEPSSFDFTNERNLREKKKKGYDTHYTYATEDGHTSFIVERKYTDEAREKKQFILHSKWKNGVDDSQRWIAKATPEPRVIWNLPKLKVAKTNRVLVAEGEKAAAHYGARNLIPVTTWSCGTYCVLKNDWSPLLSRDEIILSPDNDAKGREAMHKLAMHLVEDLEYPIQNISWVDIPEDWPKGWDIADETPDGTDVHSIICNAAAYAEVNEGYKEIWNEQKLSKIKKEVQESKAERLNSMSEDLCYIQELDEILDLRADKLIPLRNFNNNLAYLKIGTENPSTYLLKQETFNRAHEFEYNPKRKKGLVEVNGVVRANRYQGPSIIGRDGSVKHWTENLENMFEDQDRSFETEQYLAWCLQNQGDKAMWCPLWISTARGIGKNYLTRILTDLYGIKNIRPNLKYKNVVGRFNSWIIGAQFAVVNEIFISKNYNKKMEMSEEIKDLITEPYAHIEEKFRRPFDYPNTCNFLLISNHEDCMNIDNGERRYYVTKLAEKIRGEEYWKPKWNWLNNENGSASVLKHLMELKIKNPDMYKGRAPVTDDMLELAASAGHPIHKWLDEHRAAESGPFRRQGSSEWRVFNFMIVAVDLHRAVTAGFKQESALDTILEWIKTRCVVWKNGEKTRQVRLDNGERPRAYMLPPMYDAEAADPESAKNYWINNLREKTDTELGVVYNSKGTIKPFF